VNNNRHVLSLLLENESGALSRVAGLFSARGYNIEALSVAPTDDPTLSRMTLVTSGTSEIIEQITKQLNKLVDVVRLVDVTEAQHIERELMLIKIRAEGEGRAEAHRLAEIFRAAVIDVTESTYTVEMTGYGDKLDAFIQAVGQPNIIEVVRSGPAAVARGARGLTL
jgi:acetolactate synthase-1/3 small subunit